MAENFQFKGNFVLYGLAKYYFNFNELFFRNMTLKNSGPLGRVGVILSRKNAS